MHCPSPHFVPSGVLKPSVAATSARGANVKQPVAATGPKAGDKVVPLNKWQCFLLASLTNYKCCNSVKRAKEFLSKGLK